METRRDERISQLIQALKRSDKLHLKEAATLLGVSEMTIRRDLNGHSGPVVLLGGYIVLEPRSATHYLLSDQKTRLVDEKRRAARHAAKLLEPHQMAFFDCGTTTPWIIDAIDSALPFTGVCYSLNTFLSLQEKPQCRAILCGGEFHAAEARRQVSGIYRALVDDIAAQLVAVGVQFLRRELLEVAGGIYFSE